MASRTGNTNDDDNEFVDILMDSGSTTHVCPKWFVKSDDIIEPKNIQMHMADGKTLLHYGSKEVKMKLEDGTFATLTFEIADVLVPIISVTKAIAHGSSGIFGSKACMKHPHGKTVPLNQKDKVFYLRGKVIDDEETH